MATRERVVAEIVEQETGSNTHLCYQCARCSLMALAFGLETKKVELDKNMVDARPVL